MTTATEIAATGFVRVPRPWIALDVSPAARALLVHFCGAANADGESWYSYEQLAAILDRSKAAVSGYVAELREAGVLETERQKLANGFNYRLLVRLVGWSDLVSGWKRLSERGRAAPSEEPAAPGSNNEKQTGARRAGRGLSNVIKATAGIPAAPAAAVSSVARPAGRRPVDPSALPGRSLAASPAERSVRPAEHKDPSGPIKIHPTKTLRPAAAVAAGADRSASGSPANAVESMDEAWKEGDEALWRRARPVERDGGSQFDVKLDNAFLAKVARQEAVLRRRHGVMEPAEAKATAAALVDAFMAKRKLSPPAEGLDGVVEAVCSARTEAGMKAALAEMDADWQPHWRRLSSAAQVSEVVARVIDQDATLREALRTILLFMHRGFIARRELKDRERNAAFLAERERERAQRQECPAKDAALKAQPVRKGAYFGTMEPELA